jgi:hypothetical protein
MRGIPLLIVLASSAIGCARIDSGRAGVLWKWFGGTQPEVYGEGVHIVAPWNRMLVYDIRTQDRKEHRDRPPLLRRDSRAGHPE